MADTDLQTFADRVSHLVVEHLALIAVAAVGVAASVVIHQAIRGVRLAAFLLRYHPAPARLARRLGRHLWPRGVDWRSPTAVRTPAASRSDRADPRPGVQAGSRPFFPTAPAVGRRSRPV